MKVCRFWDSESELPLCLMSLLLCSFSDEFIEIAETNAARTWRLLSTIAARKSPIRLGITKSSACNRNATLRRNGAFLLSKILNLKFDSEYATAVHVRYTA